MHVSLWSICSKHLKNKQKPYKVLQSRVWMYWANTVGPHTLSTPIDEPDRIVAKFPTKRLLDSQSELFQTDFFIEPAHVES